MFAGLRAAIIWIEYTKELNTYMKNNRINTYTSTGYKLLRHGFLLDQWAQKRPIPHSLQVALTEVCNLNCKFCSVKNRSKKYEFNLAELISATHKFIELGTKSVEITGGGEPLCYKNISNYIHYLHERNMKIGLITNGININDILDAEVRSYIDWIRISANVFDYTKKIETPIEFPGTLGFSYVWTDDISTLDILRQIRDIAIANNIEYIRVVPNCLGNKQEQNKKNKYLAQIATILGYPFFFQRKEFNTPLACYWGYFKPFLYPDGYVYPCSSVVLNSDADKQFHESYRLCHWTDVDDIWKNLPISSLIDTQKCDHCVFIEQNEILNYSLHSQKHEDFI